MSLLRPTRRSLLAALGGAAATVPLLGAFRAFGANAPVQARLLIVQMPNGMLMSEWTPTDDTLEVLPPALAPLAPWRDDMLVITGLRNTPSDGIFSNVHANRTPALLTGEDLATGRAVGVQGGRSFDQVVADAWGETSLVLCPEGPLPCVQGVSITQDECTGHSNLSWRGPWDPVPPEIDPIAVRERLFGLTTGLPGLPRNEWLRRHRAATDAALVRASSLLDRLPASDRPALAAWIDALDTSTRSLEAPPMGCGGTGPVPSDDPSLTGRLVDDLSDVVTLALQSATSRVVCYSVGRELSRRIPPVTGVDIGHHTLSHYTFGSDFPDKLRKVIGWQMGKIARLIGSLADMPTCDGARLLDDTIVLLVATMSDPQQHDPSNLPVALIGGRNLGYRGGRVLHVDDQPISRLYLRLLLDAGLEVDTFGASGDRPLDLG